LSISLYEASVGNYLQILNAMTGVLAKGRLWCAESGVDAETLVETALYPDMRPFRFQVQSAAFHSLGAVEAMRSGVLNLVTDRPAHDYAGLEALVAETRDALSALTPESIDALAGREVVFEARGMRRLFSTEGFLLSFSLPNFYFHATTAYGILRSRGVPIGKIDYMGQLRLKG